MGVFQILWRRFAAAAMAGSLIGLAVVGAPLFLPADSMLLRPFGLPSGSADEEIAGVTTGDTTGAFETASSDRSVVRVANRPNFDLAANIAVPSVPDMGSGAATSGRTKPSSARADSANDRLLQSHYALLKAGRERFSHLPGYTATLQKRELIGSELSEEVTLSVKVRHEPFSVYMKWITGEAGKEVLYVDGENDNNLLVRLGGLKGRILPAIKVDPLGARAMGESRYPVTRLGILALADVLIERRDLEMQEHIVPKVVQQPDADCGGRTCAVYIFEVGEQDQDRSPVYRKSVQFIDRQWNVPLQVTNYTWLEAGSRLGGPALDEATLIEYYKYSEVDAEVRLTDLDFDRTNSEYRFHR